MFSRIKQWLSSFTQGPPSLDRMRLGPDDHNDNPLMIQFFTWDALAKDTTWWKHFENEIPRLAELGFTQVWLPPMNKAAENVSCRGYDAYDLWDLGEFDQKGTMATRWGSREELLEACKVAKRYRLDILVDAVLNHKHGGDATEKVQVIPSNPDNRLKDSGKRQEIEAWTVFKYAGRNGKYSNFKWNQAHFTAGVDFDQKTKSNAIYRFVGPGHKGWSRNVDNELGNYDYLMGSDIDHRHPDVREDLLKWGAWILDTTGASGFRLDAIKHIDRKFSIDFIRSSRQRTKQERLFSVAEYWSGDIHRLLSYVRMFRGESAFFDVPLHMNLCQASRQRSRYDLRNIFKDTLAQRKPRDAVTFVDNHDTVEGQSLESWVEPAFKIQAYALILLRGVGHPCVFYGDLYPNEKCYNENIARNITLLVEARQKFAYGQLEDYFHDRNCIGFVRKGNDQHLGCAVILSNKEEDSSVFVHNLRMNVGKENAGATFRSFMTQHGQVEIDSDGWGVFTCFANHIQVWVKA
ncbi:glycoside hydrolase family 13 protein [Macrolepiota fuliginosa MF-IS2]|uniref:Glycoside hydrolase family 13 protein n=1 Tax=Macrolepiota fuliginosa MF-IS2 TaxID=1400762 RepID=A0A9P6C722_9AGAR|nr:glycoside hydrolase family 13 protein [Macrolepiota fuliginosa MF-IS2]